MSDSSGDKSQTTWGGLDYWVVCIDSDGNKLWDKDIGSEQNDVLFQAAMMPTGEFSLAGWSYGSGGGDKTVSSFGSSDYWLVRCNSDGSIIGQQDYGGTNVEDELQSVQVITQGKLLIACTSYSDSSGNKSENNLGPEQCWVILADSIGNKIWDKTFLTSSVQDDEWCTATLESNGCIWVAISTSAGIGGDKTEAGKGGTDFFILKLCDSSTMTEPQSIIQPLVTKICPDSCIAFGNQSTNATSYEWFFQGGNPSFSNVQFPTNICYSASGTYDVTLIAHNGPYSDTTVSQSLIQVYAPPTPTILQSNDTLYATNVNGSNTFQWSFNNAAISGATNNFYIPTQNGTYSVNVVNPQGCSNANALVVTNVGIEAIHEQTLRLFPNPADESVSVRSNSNEILNVGLYNALGQRVQSQTSAGTATFNVSKLPAGIYYVRLQSNRSVAAARLTVSHR